MLSPRITDGEGVILRADTLLCTAGLAKAPSPSSSEGLADTLGLTRLRLYAGLPSNKVREYVTCPTG